MNSRFYENGFSVVELLIAIVIITILAGLGLFLSMDLYRSHTFRADEKMFISILQKARVRSLSNINQSKHGVKLDGDDFVLFQGADYATRNVSLDESFPVGSGMTIAWPAPSEVVFDQLNGNIDAGFLTGDIIIMGPGQTATILLNSEGRIDY